jgi:hypothetical protein
MQVLTIELKGNNSLKALQELEKKDLIRIVNEPDLNSYVLPGENISDEDFVKWIEYSENSITLGLNESKARWEQQRKKLQKLIR